MTFGHVGFAVFPSDKQQLFF